MPRFEVRVRLTDVVEPTPAAARQRVADGLRAAGLERFRIVSVRRPGSGRPLPRRRRQFLLRDQTIGAAILIIAIVAWWLSFFWAVL